MTRTKLIFTGILFATVGLTGCANWSHQEKGTAAGAVVGGALQVARHLLRVQQRPLQRADERRQGARREERARRQVCGQRWQSCVI